jgi:hypothetical protein
MMNGMIGIRVSTACGALALAPAYEIYCRHGMLSRAKIIGF